MLLILSSLLSLLGQITATRVKVAIKVSMHQNTYTVIKIIVTLRNKELGVYVLLLGRH